MQKASDSAPALASFSLDALPVINHFLEPLDLSTVLEAYLPPPHPRRRVPPVQAIGLLLRNLLLSREPSTESVPGPPALSLLSWDFPQKEAAC